MQASVIAVSIVCARGAISNASAWAVVAPELQASGWNNQRQSLVAAMIFARHMNRTLVLPSAFNPSFHDMTAYEVDRIIDIPLLRQYVAVAISDDGYSRLEESGQRVTFDAKCSGITPETMRAAGELVGERGIWLGIGWNYGDVVFKTSLTCSSPVAMEAYAHLRPPASYRACAASIVAAIKATVSVHLRIGHKLRPYPLMDCESHGYATRNDTTLTCVKNGASDEVMMSEVVVGSTQPNATIYAASNDRSAPIVRAFRRDVARTGRAVVFYDDLDASVVRSSDACRSIVRLDVSVLEQAICAETDLYYPSFYSSWDEWPLHMRHGRSVRDDAQLALFVIKVRAMANHQRGESYWADCRASNFFKDDEGTIAHTCECGSTTRKP